MLPVIAIIGRPNVGKSTLFNRLTKSRDALVADFSGLTRDRQYGEGCINLQRFLLIDTGGIGIESEGLCGMMLDQAKQALEECDAVLFLVDGRAGRNAADEAIAAEMRSAQKPVYVVVNKTDGIDPAIAMSEFHAMGLGQPIPIAASQGTGVISLMTPLLRKISERAADKDEKTIQSKGIKFAVVGRPNVGKSTLVNRILGEERVIVFDEAGTTRDSIFIPFERRGKEYTIIDTAGMRRRSKVSEKVEKFSIIKTLQAIESANVVIYVVDAKEGIVEHDLRLLGFVLEAGRGLVIAVNKCDGLTEDQKGRNEREHSRRLGFVDFAKTHYISALHGTGVGNLFETINKVYQSATKKFTTNVVTKILEKAVEKNQPPLVRGQRIKLRYAHMGGNNPPIVVIHGNQTTLLPMNYKRYLMKTYRTALKLVGTPIRLQFKTGDNPFKDKKNVLTERQKQKRKRLKKYVQKGR